MASCVKCDAPFRRRWLDETSIVDIAHSGEDWSAAKEKIDRAINSNLTKGIRRLKVVHGYGSEPGHSRIIHDKAVPYLTECARKHRAKLLSDEQNHGVHVLDFGI